MKRKPMYLFDNGLSQLGFAQPLLMPDLTAGNVKCDARGEHHLRLHMPLVT